MSIPPEGAQDQADQGCGERGVLSEDADMRWPCASSGGAVSRTRQGAFFRTYSVAAPISAGLAAPIPPSVAPPLILLGGSPPITIASVPWLRAASTMPAPTPRAR